MSEMKNEDIIKSLRVCARFDACEKCIFANEDARCSRSLMEEAADRLEWLATENELLHGALASCGAPKNTESKEENT